MCFSPLPRVGLHRVKYQILAPPSDGKSSLEVQMKIIKIVHLYCFENYSCWAISYALWAQKSLVLRRNIWMPPKNVTSCTVCAWVFLINSSVFPGMSATVWNSIDFLKNSQKICPVASCPVHNKDVIRGKIWKNNKSVLDQSTKSTYWIDMASLLLLSS